MPSTHPRKSILTILAAFAATALITYAFAQSSPKTHSSQSQSDAQTRNDKPAGQPNGGFPDLVGGLKDTPGCLGVETAQTASGKNVIFAWFENKKAALNWYDSDMHLGVMKKFFPGSGGDENHEPMAGVPDDIPLMAVASVTFADKPHFDKTNLPVSQIAIELYTPVSGGLYLGSRFAPDVLKVNGIADYTPKHD